MVNTNTIPEDIIERRPTAHHSSAEDSMVQIEMLPDHGEVSTVVNQLGIDDLRAFATAIMNAATDSARKGHADLDTARLLNNWFASMEETVSAADSVEEIISRRRKRGTAVNALRKEIDAYERMRDHLEANHFRKWVVFHDEELIGTYESFEDAAIDAAKRFGRGPYLIRQVAAPPTVISIPTVLGYAHD